MSLESIKDNGSLIVVCIMGLVGLAYVIYDSTLPHPAAPLPKAADCSKRPFCPQIRTCKEAMHYLRDCGMERLDADHDGQPCELTCSGSY